jgi:hypothetical protein
MDATTIDFDLPCARCDYNLRTQQRDGVCPECGHSVDASVGAFARRHDRYLAVRARGVAWMRTIRGGCLIALAATLLFVTGGLATRPSSSNVPLAIVLMLPAATAIVFAFWAMWRWFSFGRRPFNAIGRLAVAWSVAAFLASNFTDRWLRYWFGRDARLPPSIDSLIYDVTDTLGATLSTILPITFSLAFARFSYLCWLAGWRFFAACAAIVSLVAACWLIPRWPQFSGTVFGVRWWYVMNWIAVAFWVALPISFAAMAYTLTRAIRLGGFPEASSSPSPRPTR